MLKAIMGWIRRAVATVGSLFSKLIRLTFNSEEPEEQYMKKHKHKEIFAQGETADDRKREDSLFARMKEHHDLAKDGDRRRSMAITGHTGSEIYKTYDRWNQAYFKTFDTEGPDVAYAPWCKALEALEEYVKYLDYAVADLDQVEREHEPELSAAAG